MRMVKLSARPPDGPAVSLLLAAAVTGVAPKARAVRTVVAGPAFFYTVSGRLDVVAPTSARSALAVGYSVSGLKPSALVVHWNGIAWKRCPARARRAASWKASPRPPRTAPGRSARRQRQDLDPALERHRLEANRQPEPGRRRLPQRRGRDLR